MALIHCNFHSDVLRICTSMYLILPQPATSHIGTDSKSNAGKHPTLYLLHGLSDDHTIWLRMTSIERYAGQLGIAVVMPAVNRSFYTDMAHGHKYWTFVTEELPAIARSFFPLSDKREDNFAAGLSMGGYGAFKLALRCPEKFAAAASLSGALDVAIINPAKAVGEVDEFFKAEYANIFKGEVARTEDDLFYLADRLASSKVQPPLLYQCCGTEDFLYQDNIRFRDHAIKLGLPLTYEEEPGTHEWGYWDMKIKRVLEWLPLKAK